MRVRFGVHQKVDLTQRQNSKASRSSFRYLLQACFPSNQKSRVQGFGLLLLGDMLTEVVLSVPSRGRPHRSLSTCNAFPEGTIFTKRDAWLPSLCRVIATDNQGD